MDVTVAELAGRSEVSFTVLFCILISFRMHTSLRIWIC